MSDVNKFEIQSLVDACRNQERSKQPECYLAEDHFRGFREKYQKTIAASGAAMYVLHYFSGNLNIQLGTGGGHQKIGREQVLHAVFEYAIESMMMVRYSLWNGYTGSAYSFARVLLESCAISSFMVKKWDDESIFRSFLKYGEIQDEWVKTKFCRSAGEVLSDAELLTLEASAEKARSNNDAHDKAFKRNYGWLYDHVPPKDRNISSLATIVGFSEFLHIFETGNSAAHGLPYYHFVLRNSHVKGDKFTVGLALVDPMRIVLRLLENIVAVFDNSELDISREAYLILLNETMKYNALESEIEVKGF